MLAEQFQRPEDAEVTDIAAGYYRVWWLLSNDRPRSDGSPGRIPFEVIERYAEKNLFDDPEHLAHVLWAMCDVYLAWFAEDQKRRMKNAN